MVQGLASHLNYYWITWEIDLGIVGEGETAISKLVQAIQEEGDCGNIPGVVMRHQEKKKDVETCLGE